MSAPGEDVPQGTSSSNLGTPQLYSSVSASPSLVERSQAGESNTENEISGLSDFEPGESTMEILSEVAALQPLITPTSTWSGIASGRSRTSFTTAMESHRASFYQADGSTIADQPTTVSEQIQSLEPPSSSTESAGPTRIEPNSTSGQSSSSDASELDVDDILDDDTTFTARTPAPPGDIYLAPGDHKTIVPSASIQHPVRATYRIGDPVILYRANQDYQRRLQLALPNPRNLATFEVVVTVPYELGREPVRLEVVMPPGNSPFVDDDRIQAFQFTVRQEPDYDENVPAPGP